MKKTAIVCCFVALGMAGCRKAEAPVTLQDRLQAHTWRLTGLTFNGAPYALEDCQRDDLQVYLKGSGYDDRGGVKCSEGDLQRSAFTYNVLPDGQTVAVTEGSTTYSYEAVYCDDHSLRMTRVIQQDTLRLSWQAE